MAKPKLYEARRNPYNRHTYCVWYTGDIALIPAYQKEKPLGQRRIVRTEHEAKAARFWADSFNENGGWKLSQ